MKLYYNKRSPFVRKVQVVAIEKGLEKQLTLIEADLKNKPQGLLDANPLGKIPALVLEDGTFIVDSPVIAAYIDSLNKTPLLIPRQAARKFRVLHIEALADGIAEAAIVAYMESLLPEEKRNQALIDKNTGMIFRTLAHLEAGEMKWLRSKRLTLAPIAVGVALGYINFRLPQIGWQKKHKKLARWFKIFEERPSMKATLPQVA